MKVQMLDTVATATGSFRQGHIYDLTRKRATKLIDRGLAKSLELENKQIPSKRRTTSLRHGDKG